MELAWYFYPLFFLAGMLAGFINTLAGNGSVFTLSLLLFAGMPAGLANGTNRLGALVQCVVSIFTFRKTDKFKPLLKNSLSLMVPAVIGAIVGANSALQISDELLTKVIGYLMIVMLSIVLLKPKRWLIETVNREHNKSLLNYLIFFGIGWYAGFIQMGMGVLFLAALVLVSKYSLIDANFIKIIISFTLFIPALAIYMYNDQVDWLPAIALSIGQGLGAWIATKFALENKQATLWVRRILIVMISLAIIKLFNLYSYFI
jgi:uncharacterized membrane protein YfcA